jgi:hypothetical protein
MASKMQPHRHIEKTIKYEMRKLHSLTKPTMQWLRHSYCLAYLFLSFHISMCLCGFVLPINN